MSRDFSAEEFARVEELFDRAIALEAGERERLLEEVDSDEPRVGERLRRLLEADASDTGIPIDRVMGESLAEASGPRERLGDYRIEERIGEGGMGVVYRALQERPIRRRVAIKLVRWGFESERVVARFQAEAQALATMNHPYVAQVHGAGTSEEGQPYFVMELIDGQPLGEYCEARRLGLRARVELMIAVCSGVQHAHHKGIVHRDLKPSNILVVEEDGGPAPRIIDFGVAKAAAGEDLGVGEPRLTRRNEAVGTLEYMAPEQAGAGDIDSRADVYALGVLLYELLTGELPLEPEGGSIETFTATLRDREPERPSRRWNDAGAGARARSLRSEPSSLERRLRGDLDWIVLKALEKDREHRYGSPAELAADLRRYLDDEPVSAGSPSTVYRLRKLVRRHRVAFAVSVLVLGLLVAAVMGTSLGMLRAREAEAEARLSEARARTEAETAQRVSDFMTDLFRTADPRSGRGGETPVRFVLDEAVEKIRTELSEDRGVRGTLLASLGTAYSNTGLLEEARGLFDEAVALEREGGLERRMDLASALMGRGVVLRRLDAEEAAERDFLEALELQEAACGPDCDEIAETANALGVLLRGRDPEAAAEYYRRALRIRERHHGADDPNVLRIRANLGALLAREELYEEAAAELVRALETGERLFGPDHPDLATFLGNLAFVRRKQGRLEEALELQKRDLAIVVETLGAEHPTVGLARTNLSLVLQHLGRYEEALEASDRAVAALTASLDDDHRLVIIARTHRASHLVALGRLDEAQGEAALALDAIGDGVDAALGARVELLASGIQRRLGNRDLAVRWAVAARDRASGEEEAKGWWAEAHALASAGEAESLRAEQAAAEGARRLGDGAAGELARARFRALRGDGASAAEHLEKAIDAGLANRWPLDDPELAAARRDPAFAELRRRLDRRLGSGA